MEIASFIPHPYSSLKEHGASCALCGSANGIAKLKGIIVWMVFGLGLFKSIVKQML